MSATVTITDTTTGRSVEYVDPYNPHEDVGYFIWEEGNYACDCNRALFFFRALGETKPKDIKCGGDRFTISITYDGKVVYSETKEAQE